jgi:hypothetical protein
MAYPTGQCTWFVWHRPGFIHAIDASQNLGGARLWRSQADGRGLTTRHTPRPESAVLFHAGVGRAGATSGHVAVCTAVASIATISVVEIDWPTPDAVDRRSGINVVRGIDFIYNPAEAPMHTTSQKHAMVSNSAEGRDWDMRLGLRAVVKPAGSTANTPSLGTHSAEAVDEAVANLKRKKD